jgi:hypothetical protein
MNDLRGESAAVWHAEMRQFKDPIAETHGRTTDVGRNIELG